VDPFAVLGLRPDASPEQVAARYRSLAKRFHPDRAGGRDAERRMAQINAAYDAVRAERRRARRAGLTHPTPAPAPAAPAAPRRPAGWWLDAATARRSGPSSSPPSACASGSTASCRRRRGPAPPSWR
jgi:curved DNA-binding protein CbpA